MSTGRASRLDEIGERDGWRCWLCDEPVDPQRSVNDARGPSVDSMVSDAKKASRGKANPAARPERLAHRGCNTGKGAQAPVVPWPERLLVADPAPLIAVAERLQRKGGREVVGRCPSREDAEQAADWLVDRMSRLAPGAGLTASIQAGGGQYLVALST